MGNKMLEVSNKISKIHTFKDMSHLSYFSSSKKRKLSNEYDIPCPEEQIQSPYKELTNEQMA